MSSIKWRYFRMCGIGAIIKGNVKNVIQLMEPVGNRGEAECFNEHKIINKTGVLACNRLKIVGRDKGSQPQVNEDNSIFVVFNGEIFNYKELNQILIKKGHKFKTDCDTETLVHGYEEWGDNLPKKLRGQFSFVIYDVKKDKFLAVRDHFGIKPLYFAKNGETIYFASELKQLVPFADKIEEVKPGHFVNNKGVVYYYKLPKIEVKDNFNTIIQKIRLLFDNSVKEQVQTDFPIAVFLSGGLDSTAILATARKYHNHVAAISIGDNWDSENSDYRFTKKYCEENDIPLISINPPSEEELAELIPEIVRIAESFEPNVIKQSALSYYLAKLAKEYGFKIVLCGEGADEIFCGYPEFLACQNYIIQEQSLEFFEDLYRTQLQRVDRTAMFHTVEVRVPFLDVRLVEYCINIPAELRVKQGITKNILREAMKDRLPDYIINRKKVVLSEGMGLKGNSLKDGLFTDILKPKISNKELEYYRKEFPEYKIQTKEESYYLENYLKFGYNKLVSKGRPKVNKISSIKNTVDEIYKIITKKKYKREKPFLEDELKAKIEKSLQSKEPIKLIGFWGVGERSKSNWADIKSCEFLNELNQEVKQVYTPGIEFTFILATMHGVHNGINIKVIESYIADIKELFNKFGFKYVLLDYLWKKYNISFENINLIFNQQSAGWWDLVNNKEKIELNASKRNKRLDLKTAAQKYYIMRNLEKEMLEKEFSNSIFHTFSDSSLRNVLPKMPTIYLYSRKGWSNAPWFVNEES